MSVHKVQDFETRDRDLHPARLGLSDKTTLVKDRLDVNKVKTSCLIRQITVDVSIMNQEHDLFLTFNECFALPKRNHKTC